MFAAVVGQSWATATHPYNLEINGTDYIASVPMGSIRIDRPGPGSNGSMSFVIRDAGPALPMPHEWDEVRFIEHAADRPVLFGGFVQSSRVTAWSAGGRDITVECVGYGILLDRKVVTNYQIVSVEDNVYVPGSIISLINRHGGRISGLGNGYKIARNALTPDPQYTIVWCEDWVWQTYPAGPDVDEPMMLRAVLESWADASSDFAYAAAGAAEPRASRGMTFWVDEYARLRAHPNLDESLGAANANYDGDAPVAISESTGAGLVRAEVWDFERENTDLLTGVYVNGGAVAGTGFVRRGGHERAGDLETIVNQPVSTTALLLQALGDGVIAGTQAVDARATVAFSSATPVEIRPGQKLTASSTPLDLSSETFRISGVSIAFANSAYRTYTVTFGGPLQAPSAMRRSGRYRTLR